MRQRAWVVAMLALLVAGAALSSPATGAHLERRIERLVASPTPAGTFLLLSDQAVWRVDVPTGAVATVDASAAPGSLFYLRAERMQDAPATSFVPIERGAVLLGSAGAWRVTVDPAAGVAVDIRVAFRGHAAGVGGVPASITLTPLARDQACLLPSVCLP